MIINFVKYEMFQYFHVFIPQNISQILHGLSKLPHVIILAICIQKVPQLELARALTIVD
jgi:hypothetical protein